MDRQEKKNKRYALTGIILVTIVGIGTLFVENEALYFLFVFGGLLILYFLFSLIVWFRGDKNK